jgi:DNA-binding transcriptional ArsR family regulator
MRSTGNERDETARNGAMSQRQGDDIARWARGLRDHALPMTNPFRTEICRTLGLEGTMSVSRLADALELDRSSISKHVTRLRQAGFVHCMKSDRRTLCRLSSQCTCARLNGQLQLRWRLSDGAGVHLCGPDMACEAPDWVEIAVNLANTVLCSESRLRVLWCVAISPNRCVSSIAECTGLSLALASHHVASLRGAELFDVEERRRLHFPALSGACRRSESGTHIEIQFRVADGARFSFCVQRVLADSRGTASSISVLRGNQFDSTALSSSD